MTTKLKVGPLTRAATVSRCEIRTQEDGTKRFSLSLSSEYPVDRGWGPSEILSHDAGAIRLDRAKNGSMPLLFNHNWDDPVGMVDKATLKNKRLQVEGAFFNTQRAADVAAMVEGGLRNVSVGYRINDVEENKKDGTYTVTDWEPYEASIAPVPADPSVGVGRGAEMREVEISVRSDEGDEPKAAADSSDEISDETTNGQPAHQETRDMTTQAEAAGNPAGKGNKAGATAASASDDTSRVQVQQGPTSADIEDSRIRAIRNFAKSANVGEDHVSRWITSGTSVDVVSDEIVRILEKRGQENPQKNVANLDMSANEVRQFSIVRAIRAVAEKNWKGAGFEAECSAEISKRLNTVPDPNKFYVPYDVQARGIAPSAIASQQRALRTPGASPLQTRADTVASASTGGYLVQTTNVGFIELLRNRAVAYRLGARQLGGLVGNVNVPKQSAAATAYWQGSENTQITETEQSFGQLALSPHTVGAYTEVSRLLLLQSSPDVEGIVNADLAAVAALAIDKGVLSGTGNAGQPLGITNVSGVGSISGSNITAIDYTGQLKYQTALANANVMPTSAAYVTTPTVAAFMMGKTRFANTNTPLWDGNLWDANGALGVAGFPGMSSNQIASQTVIFGDWNSVVVAEWGVLEIEVNPYANFQAGIIGIRALMTLDVGLRYPAAFAVSSTTTS